MWVLLNGLPPDAAVWRIEGRQWTQHDEFLALIAERIDAWGLMNARLHLEKKKQKYLPKEALQITRPGEQTDKRDRVITDAAAIKKFFG